MPNTNEAEMPTATNGPSRADAAGQAVAAIWLLVFVIATIVASVAAYL